MKRYVWLWLFLAALGCKEEKTSIPDAQGIVDGAIEAAGGDRYRTSRIRFVFRDREYITYREEGQRVLERITVSDTGRIADIRRGNAFTRIIDGIPRELADTTRQKLSDAVNSVHYFAYLPYGLNDPAVNKTYLGIGKIGDSEYHKIQVTFDREGGGTDYDDVFVYWFHTQTLLPEYLAYEYHTNGGGKRFREAYNERRVEGIRFVDYRNFKYYGPLPVSELDSLFEKGELEELSKIVLTDVQVTPGSYN
jgi:hypothetical protein